MERYEFHELANIFPRVEGKERQKLESSIARDGLIDPITTHDGRILDGADRYDACIKTGVTPRYVEWDGEGGSPLKYVLARNLKRRQLSKSQLSMVAAKLANIRHGGVRRGDQTANLQLETMSRADAGDLFGASERSVNYAAKVQSDGSPGLNQAVESGEVAVATAATITVLPAEQQDELVARGEAAIKREARIIEARDKVERERQKVERAANSQQAALYDLDEEKLTGKYDGLVKFGQVWQCGEHRFICGDSSDPQTYVRLMDGATASCTLTDPPYNVDYVGKTKDALTIAGDKLSNADFRQLLFSSFSNLYRHTDAGGAIYIFHADSERMNFEGAMRDACWDFRQTLIWVKQTFVMGRQKYHWRHEPILVGWKPGASQKWLGDRTEDTVFDEMDDTVLRYKKPARNEKHPTSKPTDLCAHLLQLHCPTGGIVLDGFLGSGSTAVAAAISGRICYGVEYDPVYMSVVLERMEEALGLECKQVI